MADIYFLLEKLLEHFKDKINCHFIHKGQLTIEISPLNLIEIFEQLKTTKNLDFEMLMDVSGIDYLTYGLDEWKTDSATFTGFSRGVMPSHAEPVNFKPKARFALAYQLLSITNNQRLRIKTYLENDPPIVDSVIGIWDCANWYEREAFDLYGILFNGHPDLRRLLTDYGFVGHPFRKDFPLIGNVEMRYDATAQRCVYEPVSIRARTLVPKVIREDHRYVGSPLQEEDANG